MLAAWRGFWIGTSGWRYPPWRGAFYPAGLAQRRELEHLSRRVSSIEINGSFYALQRPENYRSWAAEAPDDFVFAVKGGRFITHLKQLREVEAPLANFFASGVLALGPKLGPILWQLPPRMRFDAERLAAFLALLPRTTGAAARLATGHDERLDGRALTETDADRPLRHALEVRHESFRDAGAARAAARARHRAGGRRLGRHLAVLRGGHGRVPLRPAARRGRALRQRLHRRGARRAGRRRCAAGSRTGRTRSSTSTTTPRCTPRGTRSALLARLSAGDRDPVIRAGDQGLGGPQLSRPSPSIGTGGPSVTGRRSATEPTAFTRAAASRTVAASPDRP